MIEIENMTCPFCVVMSAKGSHIPSYFLVVTKVEKVDVGLFYLYFCMGCEGDNPQNAGIDLDGLRVLVSINDWNFYEPSEDNYLSALQAIMKMARMTYYNDNKAIKTIIRRLPRGVIKIT